MTDRAPLEHTCSLQAPPDTTSGEGGPREPQRLLPEPPSPREPQRLLPEPPSPTREIRIVLHDASAVKIQEPLADVRLEALDIRADADYKDDAPAIDLGLWYRHACRPYLVKFATGQPSYEVKQITQDAEELRNWIKEDLLRTGRALFTLEFDEIKRINVQEQRRMAKVGLRKKLFHMIFKKRVRQHDTPQGQQSLNETGSVRSDGSGSSWDSANSNSSQTSESAMDDTEQSCAQLLRYIEDARLRIDMASLGFLGFSHSFEGLKIF
ncbi:hypothetical protein ACHAPE_003993 [Trichoderma viride]